MTTTYVPSLRDRALGALAHEMAAMEAHTHNERKRWIALQRNRFVSQVAQLGHLIIPEQVALIEVGDGIHQELTAEIEGVQFRMLVDWQVHRCLAATLVCSYCGQGCVNKRIDGLEDLGRAYEELACHEERCLDGLMAESHDGEDAGGDYPPISAEQKALFLKVDRAIDASMGAGR